ncbi:concanavalin A-like lectin/glucanase domain-containing protein [Kalaharituber pfeilii]|nr:concanavalin A-like lectin/glucanase domain-containing protein [Kalaharituber pfeilii]
MKRFSLSAAAVCLAATIASAQEWQQDPTFSIGLTTPLSADGWNMPGWTILGVSQILRDRIIMTPPHPGSQRSAIWAEHSNPYNEWSVEIEFRANGEERSGGSFHFWYSAGGVGYHGTESVYTAKPWDGLAILVDKYGPYGGSVRGFLNDGKTDYSIHHNVASLAFGHCDFSYRNMGNPSKLKITHTFQGLKVETDGRVCFETRDVRLPAGNHFGLSAASADSPDSFELFSMKLSTPEFGHPHLSNDANQQQQQHVGAHDSAQDHWQKSQEAISQKRGSGEAEFTGKLPHEVDFQEFKETVPEHEASYYKSPEVQFKDLHDRLTALYSKRTHHLAAIQVQIGSVYDKADASNHRLDDFREESRHTRVPREQIDRMEGRLSTIESMLRELEKALHSTDYSRHFDSLHSTLRDQHSNLLFAVPDSIADAIHSKGPKIPFGVWLILLFQGALVAAYVMYKRKRASGGVKKYV